MLLVVVLAAVAAAGWWLSRPMPLGQPRLSDLAALTGEADRGEAVFHAGGCASCHAAEGAEGEARLVLSGGHKLETEFGTFAVPNISPDPAHGIGDWTLVDFANAMVRGVSPDGQHYYPAFPYTAYARMTDADLVDLWAFLQTVPPSDRANDPSALAFPYSVRRGIGLWKRRYLDEAWVAAAPTDTLERGRYLVEALGHCAECHTPRDRFGGLDTARWMGGAPNPSGRGTIPNITPAALTWSAADIVYYLESGFTPDFDSVGGTMAAVVRSFAELPEADREAVAAYVKGLAPIDPAPGSE